MAVEWIAFHLTDRCQLDCQHCLRDPAKKPLDLAVPLLERVLDRARAVYSTSHVSLTGGEPALHPEFGAVIDAIVSRSMTWHMVSNGKRFRDVLADLQAVPARLAGLTAVNFSLDGASEAVHDGIRGAGSFREVMEAVTICRAVDLDFVLQMTVHAKNLHEVEALATMASHLGARRVQFCMTQPTGTLHDAALALPRDTWKALGDRIERLVQTLRMEITMAEGFFQPQPFHVCKPFMSDSLHVDVNGRLNLCCQHSGVAGDGERDVAGDLTQMDLAAAHARLVTIIHEVEALRLAAIAEGRLEPWDYYPCNWCMKQFGKPHWTDEGAAGPEAARERWVGAWSRDKQEKRGRSLPIVS